MIETFVTAILWILTVCLIFAGIYLATVTTIDVYQCGRLTFEHLVKMFCAGSAYALAIVIVVL